MKVCSYWKYLRHYVDVSGVLHRPPLYPPPQGKGSSRDPLNRRLGGIQTRCGQFGEQKNPQYMPGIETRFPGNLARCLVTIPPMVFWLQQYELTYLLTSWSKVLLEKLTGSAASQEISRSLWNPKVHHRIHKCPPSVPILSQLHPPTSRRSILILSSHLRLGLPNGLFPSGFPSRTPCTPFPSPIRAICPAHLILLDFTTRTILGKE